jgi:hypothetical protein
MAVTDVSIANMALSHVGQHNQIAALSDSTEAARQCNLHFEPVRDALLRSHPWNFAVKRVRLITQAESTKNITGATAANPVVLTVVGHGYTDGERVRVEDVGGMTQINDREFTIDALTTDTFSLLDENGSAHTAYTSGGTVRKIPASEWSYWFALPSDCLRVLNVDDDLYPYKNEGGRILSNETAVNLKYVYKVTDPTLFDSQFVSIFALALAVKISVKLSDNANLKESIKSDLQDMMREARVFDAQEGGTPDGIYSDGWINSRL